MAEASLEKDTGILIHGRNLDSPDWNRMMWGFSDLQGRMGTIPTAIMAILQTGPDRIDTLTIGSGASMRMPFIVEAEEIQRTLVNRFTDLDQFLPIREHPAWQDDSSRQSLAEVIDGAVLDTKAQNTQEEIANAAQLFENRGVTNVIAITGRNHGPRCAEYQARARDVGDISSSQQWSLVMDNEPYLSGFFGSTVVVEPPHRGDDPRMNWPVGYWPSTLVQRLMALDLPQQLAVSVAIDRVLDVVQDADGVNESQLSLDV